MCVGGGELAYMWKLINDQRYSLGSRHQCKAQANTHANVVLIGREINNIYSLSTPSIYNVSTRQDEIRTRNVVFGVAQYIHRHSGIGV